VGTLVERSTRFVLLLHLPDGHSAPAVAEAMRRAISTLPNELTKSVTWDQGREMARTLTSPSPPHPRILLRSALALATGSNENTNGLLRQYMPKGADLSKFSAEDLFRIQRSLNGRPRKTLDYMMPSEKLAELVALTLESARSLSIEGRTVGGALENRPKALYLQGFVV